MPPGYRELDSLSLVQRALELGASLAGVAAVADLVRAPSVVLADQGAESPDGRVGRPGEPAAASGESLLLPRVTWPTGAVSVLVIALVHPEAEPQMDWWSGTMDPPGNRLLATIADRMCEWAVAEYGVTVTHLPYHVERGGLYLKDAAVLAGLGVIGRNNLLITPEHGPRVRLRALALSAALPSAGSRPFDPCSGCPAPCRTSCPQKAFTGPRDTRTGRLAAAGGYSRSACFVQMDADVEAAVRSAARSRLKKRDAASDGLGPVIKYCRACELTCPVGA